MKSQHHRRRARRPCTSRSSREGLAALEITLYERNRPDDTFGFGVVFSDQTLDTFKAYDLVTYERIRRRFAYWGDVDVVYKGQVLRSGGNVLSAAARASRLLIHCIAATLADLPAVGALLGIRFRPR